MEMPKKLSMKLVALVIVIAAATGVLQTADAETHIVGDSTGWTNTVGAAFYTSWAANHTFKVGDILEFKFTAGRHDVAPVTKEAFNDCNNTNLISPPKVQEPANYTLNETREYYFICAFPGHCSQGQKLSITVTTAPSTSSPPPSSPPSPVGTTAPPPPKGSASSGLAATFPTIFMSIAIGLLYQF